MTVKSRRQDSLPTKRIWNLYNEEIFFHKNVLVDRNVHLMTENVQDIFKVLLHTGFQDAVIKYIYLPGFSK